MRDTGGLESTTQVTITIQGANDTPTAVADANTAIEAGGLTNGTAGHNPSGNVLTNDTDVDAGDTKTVVGVQHGVQASTSGAVASSVTGTYGAIVINANGTYTYTVDNSNVAVQALRLSGQTLTDTFTYTMRDTGGLESTTQVTITIQGANDTPTAVADANTAVEAGGLTNGTAGHNPSGNVLTNDTDVDAGDTKTVVGVQHGTHVSTSGAVSSSVTGTYGAITINADGTYTYTVDNSNVAVQALRISGQTLTDTFTYTMRDTGGLESTTQVTITIQGANDTPTAIADSNTAIEAGGLTNGTAGLNPSGNVLTNDTDVDAGDTKTVVGVQHGIQSTTSGAVASTVTGTYGAIVINANGSYTYTVDNNNVAVQALRLSGQTLTDTFTYTMRDTGGLESTTQVTITIQGANDTPTAVADANTAIEAGGLTNGTAGLNPSGNVLTNDTDVDTGDTKTVVGVRHGSHLTSTGSVANTVAGTYGSIVINADGTYTYTVDNSNTAVQALRLSGQTLTDTFTYTMRDTGGLESTTQITLTIQGANDTPTAISDTNTAIEAGGLSNATTGLNPSGNVLTNDTDVDAGDTKTVVGVQAGVAASTSGSVATSVNGSFGSIVINANGSYTYTVDNSNVAVQALRISGQTLTDTFTYTMRDTGGLESTTQVTITIQGANDTPVSGQDTNTAIESGGLLNATTGTTPVGNVLTNDTDVDAGDTKTVVGVAAGIQSSTSTNVATSVRGLYGWVWIGANGGYSYTVDNNDPNVQALRISGQTLTDTFTYTMRDTGGLQSTNQVVITIQGANDTPISNTDTTTAIEAGGLTNGTAGLNPSGNVLSNDTDVDAGDTKTVVGVQHGIQTTTSGSVAAAVTGTFGSIVINADGSYTYTVDNNNVAVQALRISGETLTDTFTYTMRDTGGLESTNQVVVTIQGANDTPTAISDSNTAIESGGLNNATTGFNPSGNVLTNDTDVDAGDTKTVVGVQHGVQTSTSGSVASTVAGTFGSIIINANGSYTYTVDNSNAAVQALRISGETLVDTFTYTMRDTGGLQSTTQIAITITGRNDTPIAVIDTTIANEAGGLYNGTPGSQPIGNVLTNDTDVDAGDTKTVIGVRHGTHSTTSGSVASTVVGTYGSVVINSDGSYSYTVDNDNTAVQALRISGQTLTETFTYTMRDTGGLESTNQLVITIRGANDTTVTNSDTTEATEGGGVFNQTPGVNPSGNVLTNDTDVDAGDTKTVVGVRHGIHSTSSGSVTTSVLGTYGSLVINANGSYTYLVDNNNPTVQALRLSNESLTDTFTYTMQDTGGLQSTNQLVVTINSQNDNPVAIIDAATAQERGGLMNDIDGINPIGNVLDNDYDVDFGDERQVTGVVAGVSSLANGSVGQSITGLYGTLTLNADGTYDYQVNNENTAVEALQAGGSTLTDTFTYTIRDLRGFDSTTQLAITIQGANDIPQSTTDTFKAVQGKSLVTGQGVLSNDLDREGTPMIAILVEGPRNGRIVFQSDGRFIYEPDRGFIGTDLFTYTTSDGQSTGVVTTVEIIVDVGSVQDTSNNSNSNLLIVTQDGSLVAASGTGQTQEVDRGEMFENLEASSTEDTITETIAEPEVETQQASGEAEGGADRLATERQVLANLMDLREQLNRWNGNEATQAVLNTKLELNGQTYKVAVNMNKVWEQFASIQQTLKQQNGGSGFQTQEIGLDVGTFTMAASLGTIFWFLRGGAMMATLMTQVPTWKMIDPLVVMDSYSGGMEDGQSDEMNSYFDK
jgi:VCBS repeat-containing protein